MFAFYSKASKGNCNSQFSQTDTSGQEELYEDPVFMSFHRSKLLLVIIILTIFGAMIIIVKRKSKKRVLKLRSETCSALKKLEKVSLKKI